MSFAPLGARRSRGSREGKRTHLLLHLARDEKERASSIDEQRIDSAVGIALFFSPFLSASSDPFVRNFFVRTEPLAESNPVPQDQLSAIHPPCIYAGDVASAMGFGLCRSKMMNGIVALHSPPMRKDAAEKNGTLLRSAGCVGSRITRELFTLKFKHVGAKCYPALLLRSNRSLLMQLRRRFFAFSSLWTGALMDTGREQAKRVVRNGKKDTTTSPLCWTAGANTVNKAYELSVLWQRSLYTEEPNNNGSKPSSSFQLVRFPGVAGPDYMGTDPSSSESRLFTNFHF
ncbi:hypothetical protein H6P81_021651 [Aristolochia fimbriata]|uniref:Cytochrome c biogenesis ccmF n=1 Tax=Aristolochia fimbriata TaxID=158543 RepID=A0AAV7DQC4_ARIFI|nr:hypothetical protein H6P81_021651 [Aristolochia fimbriata]